MSTSPRSDVSPESARGMGSFGVWLFIVSLSILFAASIIFYLLVRSRAPEWPPPGSPKLPAGLWVSTVILLVSSGTMHGGLHSIRRNRYGALIGLMLITALLGACFVFTQAVNWAYLRYLHAEVGSRLYLGTFYLLTGLHALHVLGGLIMLGVVTAKAFGGRYSRDDHAGVKNAAIYWHFLDVVWIILFAVLVLI